MTDALVYARVVIAKLVRAGYIAYFAGGWVRDYFMGHPSEDIDIATDAPPIAIMDLFPCTLLVGLSFGVVIVVIDEHQFEVATFRKDLPSLDGRHPQGIEHSTPREDALRRDFTINGMFYDPLEDVIHDYVDGQHDIRRGIIRTIGDPNERFFEDRLRMLRAFRFAARFGFAIDNDTQEAIRENAYTLFPAVAMERVWHEFEKMAIFPRFDQALVDMHRLGLLSIILPELSGIHLHQLQHQVQAFAHFPMRCNTILYIMQLCIELPLDTKLAIARRLRVSNKDIKLLEWVEHVRRIVEKENKSQDVDLYEWALIFAYPDCWLGLKVVLASYTNDKRDAILHNCYQRYETLKPHVQRLESHKPLVSAALLKQAGIRASREMGILLKEAEMLAINEDWHHAEPIIAKLMTHPLWHTS